MERCPEAVVVDASVVAKWFIPEVDTEKALRIRDKHVTGELHLAAPDLLLYEVSNALRYREDIAQEQLTEDVETLFTLEVDLEPPDGHLMTRAAQEARSLGISIYDACYLSLGESKATSVITADRTLRDRAKGHKVLLLQELGLTWELP